jgi:hypothetical protein
MEIKQKKNLNICETCPAKDGGTGFEKCLIDGYLVKHRNLCCIYEVFAEVRGRFEKAGYELKMFKKEITLKTMNA